MTISEEIVALAERVERRAIQNVKAGINASEAPGFIRFAADLFSCAAALLAIAATKDQGHD